jgi:hypothetical protein
MVIGRDGKISAEAPTMLAARNTNAIEKSRFMCPPRRNRRVSRERIPIGSNRDAL